MRTLTKTGIRMLSAKYRSILIKCAIINASVFIGMVGTSSAMAVSPSAYTLTTVGETDNYNYYDIVNGVRTYYQITPKSGTHYEIGTEGTTAFSIKSIKPETSSYSYYVTPQGTSEARVGADSFTGTIGSEGSPVVFHGISTTPTHPDKGGAVYNYDNAEGYSIYADFVSNTTTNYGGGVRNGYHSSAFINKIVGDFVNNSAGGVGGAIASGADCDPALGENPSINEITGNFIGNTANNGGAIYNERIIGSITGDFLSNRSNDKGGAISNINIGTIGNAAESTSGITGNFVSNTSNNGGAIYNEGAINSIEGDFILNTATTNGGAIYNTGTIGDMEHNNGSILGAFISNSAVNGGAIYNGTSGKISVINADFQNNTVRDSGGAIYNYGSGIINNISGSFEGNSGSWGGGAIMNYGGGNIISIIGTFKDNKETGTVENNIHGGGAIYNSSGSTIGTIKGTFDSNKTTGVRHRGGAIYNAGAITNIDADFINNTSGSDAGAISNYNGSTIATIGSIKGTFTGNEGYSGGAIWNYGSNIKTIEADFISNVAKNENGGAISNDGTIESVTGNFKSNTAIKKGGAIYNSNAITIEASSGHSNIEFSDNYVATGNGGAIYNTGTVSVIALNDNIVFDGNYVKTQDGKGGAIYNNDSGDIVNLFATEGKSVTFVGGADDTTNNKYDIDGIYNGGVLNINGDGVITTPYLGTVELYNVNGSGTTNVYGGTVVIDGAFTQEQLSVYNNAQIIVNNINNILTTPFVTLDNSYLSFGMDAVTQTGPIENLGLFNATLDLQNNSIATLEINDFNFGEQNNNLMIDADLAGENMDKLSITSIMAWDDLATLNISDIRLLSDATQDKVSLDLFADETTKGLLADKVTGNLNGLTYSPIYKYDALYDPTRGQVDFTRYNNGGYDDLNPAVMAGAVAAQVGGYLNQINSYENAFEHMDSYMMLSRNNRLGTSLAVKYITDAPRRAWLKPYAAFETVKLKHGPKVDNNMYGSFAGLDSAIVKLKHGWDIVYSGYASYDGSNQKYDGNSIYQNGGHLGATLSLYKGNFFTGLTANAGASSVKLSTMDGADDTTMFTTGAASKTGYDLELVQDWLIVQPSVLLSYSLVNMSDYTNASGVKISSDALHAIQIAPELKLISNLPHGWQPYIAGKSVWNMLDETKFSAAGIDLPELSTKQYVQYGIGIQKNMFNGFYGYAQAMFRNGGRDGVALNAGLKMAF